MTAQRRALAHRPSRYQSLSSFYRADRRRRSSLEQDVGLWWRVGRHGPLYRAAWVGGTGELYVTRLGRLADRRGEVLVLGRARDRGQLDAVLAGWQDVCPQPDSMTWLRHRAAGLAAPRETRGVARPRRCVSAASASERRSLAAPAAAPSHPV
jgi:hypothetical protein